MAVRGWGVSVATAAGVAAAAGAAQLGLAYGTGVITWRPGPTDLADAAWFAGVIWATWIAATSVIAGSVVADRLHSGPADADQPPTTDRLARVLWRMVLAIGAGVGAMITIALVAVPVRDAAAVDVTAPQVQAIGYVAIGVVAGVVISVGALAARAVAANLIATAGWLWALATAVVVEGAVAGRDWSVVSPAYWEPEAGQWWGSLLLPGAGVALAAALVIGALAALPAVRRGDHPVGVVVSGGAGPLVLTVAYLLAQPDLTAAGAEELSRHLLAPYLVLAGIVGSLLISAVRRRGPRDDAEPDDDRHDRHDRTEADADGQDAALAVPAARQPA